MGKVDGLSRRLDWQVEVKKDNEDKVLVKAEWLRRTEETIVEKGDLRGRIRETQKKDKKIVKIVKKMKRTGVKSLRDKEWSIKEGLVLKEDRIYIPERLLMLATNHEWWQCQGRKDLEEE